MSFRTYLLNFMKKKITQKGNGRILGEKICPK